MDAKGFLSPRSGIQNLYIIVILQRLVSEDIFGMKHATDKRKTVTKYTKGPCIVFDPQTAEIDLLRFD